MNVRARAVFVCVLFWAGSVQANSFIARNAGMGGVGVASSNYDAAAVTNPALLTEYQERDDLALVIPSVGIEVSDENDVLDSLDVITDQFVTLGQQIVLGDDAGANTTKDSIITGLEDISGQPAYASLGGVIGVSRPGDTLGWAVTLQSEAEGGAFVDYDPADEALLDQAILTGDITLLDDVESQGFAIAAAVSELSLSLAREFSFGGLRYSLGITPKFQRVDTLIYSETVNSFDSDEFKFSSDVFARDDSGFNLDVGASLRFGKKFNVGLVVKDLIEEDYATVMLQGFSAVYNVDTEATAGLAYNGSTLTLAVDMDLMKNKSFDQLGKTQFLRAGVELNGFDWAQIRLGIRHDLEDTREDLFTLGIGLSPFNVFHLDLTGSLGSNDTYGAAAEIKFTF